MNPKLYDLIKKWKHNLSYLYKWPLMVIIYPLYKYGELLDYLEVKWARKYTSDKTIKKLSKYIYKKMLRYKYHREQYFLIASNRSHWYEDFVTKDDYKDFIPNSDSVLRRAVRETNWTPGLQEQLIFELRKNKHLEVSVISSDNYRNYRYFSRNEGFIQAYKITMKS